MAKPKVFGFFIGWYGQDLLNSAYKSATGSISAEPRAGWDLCEMEVCRLGAMVDAWSTIHDKALSTNLVEALHGVARLCSPDGYPGTPEGINGTAFQLCYDAPPTPLPGCELWPNVLDGDTEFSGEFGALIQEIHTVFTMIGELTSQKNAAAAGAALCRLAFGDVSSDSNTEPYPWIESLVSLDLLLAPPGYKKALRHEKGLVALEHIKKATRRKDEYDVLMNMPLFVCDHADLPCPPDRIDVKTLPVFREHKPAVVVPIEATEPELQSEPTPKKTTAGGSTARGEEQDQEARYAFRLEGDTWQIRFEDEKGLYTNCNGLSYIHKLLRHYLDTNGDGRRVPALDLKYAVQPPDVPLSAQRSVIGYEEGAMEGNLGSSEENSTDRVFDKQAARELKKAIEETRENIADLRREIEESHSESEQDRLRKQELEPEMEKLNKLMAYKQTGMDIKGRGRPLESTTATKAREAITQAIKLAYEHLGGSSKPMKKLVAHLKKSIPHASENSFIYSPDTKRHWRL